MNDPIIRKAVHSRIIRHQHRNPNSLVIDELGILHGKARIDIAVINGSIHGYEIKSEDDHLNRLNSQISSYNSVFDKLTLVVAEKHLFQAKQLLPDWWGVVIASKGSRGGVSFDREKSAHQNPNIESLSIAQLLWKPEAIHLLESLGCKGKELSGNRSDLYNRLIERLKLGELKNYVRDILKERPNWRDHSQPL